MKSFKKSRRRFHTNFSIDCTFRSLLWKIPPVNSPELSIIIPALNEAEGLPSTLKAAAGGSRAVEWIVVDGGSDDNTKKVARDWGCRVIDSPKAQRSHQLNLGATEARADALLFLHADTRIPEDGPERILDAFATPEVVGGGFVRVFDTDSLFLKVTCRAAAWRSRKLGTFLGDQGLFVRRETFHKLGGFNERIEIAEDLDFSCRLKKLGRVCALEGPAISSARRFEKRGPVRQTLIDLGLTLRFFTRSLIPPS